jgi:hypothetical protein
MRLLSTILLGLACGSEGPVQEDSISIDLRWVQGHEEDSWERAKGGLWWSLSQLGATPPGDDSAIFVEQWSSEQVQFRLDFEPLGFSDSSLDLVGEALAELRSSDPYAQWGRIDLGRMLMLLLYEPWRYYALTGACTSLDDWKLERLARSPETFAITESMLVEGDRQVRFSLDPKNMGAIAWLAEEGEGSLESGDFEIGTTEVVDLMANGQPRYALYDSQGALIPAPEEVGSPIGQPGRCMWCHEQHLMNTVEQPEIKGSISWAEFSAQITTQQALIDAYRAEDQTATDFTEHQVHAWSELLVETFLAPSPSRVALEWDLSLEEVAALVESTPLSTHTSEEYPDFGLLLTRSEVDAASAAALGLEDYTPLPSLPSSRDLDLDRDTLQGSASLVGDCLP